MALYNVPSEEVLNPRDGNLNISAYRVLYILLLLVQYRCLSGVEMNGFLYDNPLIRRVYNAETLTKYINTLREVGCRIPRSSSRNDYNYELLKNPFPLAVDAEEWAVVSRLRDRLAEQPDASLSEGFESLLQKLSWSVNPPLGAFGDRAAEDEPDAPGSPDNRRALIRRYRKYCRELFVLALKVREEDGRVSGEQLVEPYDVVPHGSRLMLLGVDVKSQEQRMVDLERIAGVRQLPSKNRGQARQVSVVFALYGRLAKSYRLYPGEKIIFRGGERIHVKARVMETTGLMNRLLKYGPSCQVLSPVPLRETMRERLSHLLALLSTE